MSFDDAKTVVYVNCMIVIIAIDLEGTDYADLKLVVKERIQYISLWAKHNDKMKNKNYHTVGTISKSNKKIVQTKRQSLHP